MRMILDQVVTTSEGTGHVKIYTHMRRARLECEPCDLYLGNDEPEAVSHRRMVNLGLEHLKLHRDLQRITTEGWDS